MSSVSSPKAGDHHHISDHYQPIIIKEEELRYLYVSNVRVSNFVSVKLLDESNYNLWKEQMICLLDSQNMRGLVDPRFKLPEVNKSSTITEQYKSLVKGWIYGSLDEDILKRVINGGGPQEIWSALETICSHPSGSSSPKAGDHHHPTMVNDEELRYLYASNVNVSNFVSATPLTKSNYPIWKKQMLCLLDSENLRGLVEARFDLPEIKNHNIMEQYKSLVHGWIYGSLSEYLLKVLACVDLGPRYIWFALETICAPHKAPTAGDPHDFYHPIEEERWRYLYAINVDISNFVSVSHLTKRNYTTWRKQMLCLLDSENLRGFVDDTVDPPEIKSPKIMEQYESLVKDWILRSLNEDLDHEVQEVRLWTTPQSIWEKLERVYDPQVEDPIIDEDVIKKRVHDVLYPEQVEVTTRGSSETDTPPPASPDNSIKNDKLLKAVVDERWLDAKLILKNDKDAATEAIIDNNGYTMLHIAVKEGRNNFLERLLDFLDDEIDIEAIKDHQTNTALHTAAEYNNTRAAQLLVKRWRSLLFSVGHHCKIPLETAYRAKNLDTFLYLWEAVNDEPVIPHQGINLVNRLEIYIRRPINFDILEEAISTKQYGLASRLVNTFPQVAMQDDRLLMAMARTFPRDLIFGEALICPSLNNFHKRIVKRSSLLFKAPGVLYAWADHVLWATRSLKEAMWLLQKSVLILLVIPVAALYPLYQLLRLLILVILYPFFMLYFFLCTVLAIAVIPIKRTEKKRKKYQEAKEFVNTICNHIDKLGSFYTSHPCYNKPFMEAVRQGAYEVVDEILYRLPKFIESDSMGKSQTFIQLAITNRSDKIFNLIYHLNVRMDVYRKFEDSSQNNILHLAGRLAPEHILSRTTGAALQLQRELQWFQEVEKLMLPGDLAKMNADMETPHMVFTREHADLVKEGEQWMKTTSEACSITAALIVTIVFAAAITVPGGNNQETGIPLFKKDTAFIIFAVCDAISLFSAVSALLVFLSILTTRFAEKDFLVSLPRRLVIGLCALFLSTASMVGAFSAILFLVFCDQRPWMLAPIGGLTCMPIAVIVTLQLPLLVDLFKSTYIPIFGKQNYISSGKFISNHPMLVYEL